MSTALFEIRDRSGRLLRSVPNVLAPVALTGVSTTSASNILTVASTTGVYPGMGVNAPNIPSGAFVHAVKSATELELWASAFNATTGVWTTSAANAQATDNGSSMLAYAGGGAVEVTKWYAEGCWQNLHQTSSHGIYSGTISGTLTDGSAAFARQGFGVGLAVLPTAGTVSSGVYVPTAVELIKSDHLQATPIKRHEGVPRGVWILVSTGGFRSTHIINQGDSCGYAATEA